MFALGLDIGSVNIKGVIIDDQFNIVKRKLLPLKGNLIKLSLECIDTLTNDIKPDYAAITGTGALVFSKHFNIIKINEIVAQFLCASNKYPYLNTIIEMGGEDSKFIILQEDKDGKKIIQDFSLNSTCAAGTGSFLDQQATRLKLNIEEFVKLGSNATTIPVIAGRCSVFAKSDMIHLQQIATPVSDIIAGLCWAMARNFKATVCKGKQPRPPIGFFGGVASNTIVVKALENLFDTKLFIPEEHFFTGAIGAGIFAFTEKKNFKIKSKYISIPFSSSFSSYPPLPLQTDLPKYDVKELTSKEIYIGIDVGSVSTNVVIIDDKLNIIARSYLPTAGRPLEAVQKGIEEVYKVIKDKKFEVKGVGVTGSGRYLIGDFVGADIVKNEISAHAKGAFYFDKEVDTIFEIGGQDSKYIYIRDGIIEDFTMNKVCAAGTGSFLEEQATKLGIQIKEEFSKIAFKSQNPIKLGERCTVFMEAELEYNLKKGAKIEDLVAGLAYSIALNYLNRVVEKRKIGEKIFFQGGTAANMAVKAAFESLLNKKIVVPDHHDVLGAIGMAIFARELDIEKSNFRGFDLSKLHYTVESFECKDCANRCNIKKVCIEGKKTLYYGSICGKFDEEKSHSKNKSISNHVMKREQLLKECIKDYSNEGRYTIGIPMASTFFEYYPFWYVFLNKLSFKVIISGRTNREIISKGLQNINVETCFPIKVFYGHVVDLLDKNIEFILLPSMISTEQGTYSTRNYLCPYIQSLPYMIQASLSHLINRKTPKFIIPLFDLHYGEKNAVNNLYQAFKFLGYSYNKIKESFLEALVCQKKFENTLKEYGKSVVSKLKFPSFVLIGRPYNTCDRGVNLDLASTITNLGYEVITMDMLETEDIPWMYWKYGKKILSSAMQIKQLHNLFAIYITNFGCGPDSFILHQFERILQGKPYLQLEIDEHCADAGIITRVEAFIDSLLHNKDKNYQNNYSGIHLKTKTKNLKDRTLFVPYMGDTSYVLAAGIRSGGINAKVMEPSNEISIEEGKKFTSGKECYPCILTTGDMLKTMKKEKGKSCAFFMPSALGPCRFGQYHLFMEYVLEKYGQKEVPVVDLQQEDSILKAKQLFPNKKSLWYTLWGVFLSDTLYKLRCKLKPYEKEKGKVDKTYQEALKLLISSVENKRSFKETIKDVKNLFTQIKLDHTLKVPRVGIVGEIYVRSHPFANLFIASRLEEAGIEVEIASLQEWLNYTSWHRKDSSLRNNNYIEYLKESLIITTYSILGKYISKKLKIHENLNLHEPPISEILEYAQKYLHPDIRGEAILSIGRTIEFIKNGFDGIVVVAPFTCMPGTIVNAIMKKIREENNNFPYLELYYDGTKTTSMEVKIEAFIYQVKDRHKRKNF